MADLETALDCAPSKIKLVVFDLDGTLYPQKEIKRALIFRLFFHLRKLKRFSDVRNKDLKGQNFDNFGTLIDFTCKKLARNPRRTGFWKKWLFSNYYPALYASYKKINAATGVNPLFEKISEKKIKIAIVSDYGKTEERLYSLKISTKNIDFCLGLEEHGMLKPHPDVLKLITKKTLTPPENTLFIGDREDTDQALAQIANAHFIGITFDTSAPVKPNWCDWEGLEAKIFDLISANK